MKTNAKAFLKSKTTPVVEAAQTLARKIQDHRDARKARKATPDIVVDSENLVQELNDLLDGLDAKIEKARAVLIDTEFQK